MRLSWADAACQRNYWCCTYCSEHKWDRHFTMTLQTLLICVQWIFQIATFLNNVLRLRDQFRDNNGAGNGAGARQNRGPGQDGRKRGKRRFVKVYFARKIWRQHRVLVISTLRTTNVSGDEEKTKHGLLVSIGFYFGTLCLALWTITHAIEFLSILFPVKPQNWCGLSNCLCCIKKYIWFALGICSFYYFGVWVTTRGIYSRTQSQRSQLSFGMWTEVHGCSSVYL